MRFQVFPRTILAPIAVVALALPGCRDDADAPTGPEPASGSAAVTATALPVFASLAAGGSHTCALTGAGAAYCWGANGNGQLGDGTFSLRTNPVRVAGGLKFVQISAGARHTCAITTTNQAYCWGYGAALGNGGELFLDKNTPTLVAGGRRYRNVSAGNEHSCAVTPANIAFCWGLGHWGELGTGHSTFSSTPLRVFGSLQWRRVVAGGQVSCGVTMEDVAYCWGFLLGGKQPTKVPGGIQFRQVWVGGGDYTDAQHQEPDTPHACGITPEDKAYCWGWGGDGELGQGGSIGFSATPVAVSGSRRWRQVVAGFYHTCGVTRAEVPFCWGSNQFGYNGNGTRLGSNAPERVHGGLSFTSISTGVLGLHTCGLTGAGKAYCWGDNSAGELGDGTHTQRLEPVAVVAGN
jgi:alpha-tubulin suppressor-like RCC1 family protein